MKKNLVFVLMFISCIFLLAGCGNEKESSEAEDHVTPPCSAIESEEPEGPLDNITIDINTSNENYKDDDGVILLSYSGASISVAIKNNMTASEMINASLTSRYDSLITQLNDYVSLATNDYDACSTEELSYWNSYILTRDIAVGRSDSNVISLLYTDSYFLGGAHGGSLSFADNYDVGTGKILTLADLAEDKQTLINYMIPYLYWLTQKPGFADGLSWADEDTFQSIVEDGSWYLSENGLVIICNEYTIGPYVIGTKNLEIPYEDLNGILLDKWIPNEGV
jgi:hypothetical protein